MQRGAMGCHRGVALPRHSGDTVLYYTRTLAPVFPCASPVLFVSLCMRESRFTARFSGAEFGVQPGVLPLKIHFACSALGNPLPTMICGRRVNDGLSWFSWEWVPELPTIFRAAQFRAGSGQPFSLGPYARQPHHAAVQPGGRGQRNRPHRRLHERLGARRRRGGTSHGAQHRARHRAQGSQPGWAGRDPGGF